MGFFDVDAAAINRRHPDKLPPTPSRNRSLGIGIVGGAAMSLAGFAPWALGGDLLSEQYGTIGMYLACMGVFIVASGLALHWLLVGRGSLIRFYRLFSVSFVLYSTAWITFWMMFQGHAGSLLGLLVAALAMGAVFVAAFGAKDRFYLASAALFVPTTGGYFGGGVAKDLTIKYVVWRTDAPETLVLSMFSWGLFFGIGFGAGIGLAIHWCQESALRKASEMRKIAIST